jgi:2',3'-cyclic-nucleotide 2'-phosphodiesterase
MTATLNIAFLGDAVGSIGRRAIAHAVPILREKHGVHLVIANGENSRNGSGISPDNYKDLRRSGVDAITLGDHCFKDRTIFGDLDDPLKPIGRPANLAAGAPGKTRVRVERAGVGGPPVYAVTVLGRIFMPLPSDNPFSAVDREVGSIPERDAVVIVEVHGEVTSEKQAMAWHCLEKWTHADGPRVVAVVGSHTHVQTADARLIDHVLGAMTDVGMSGPHRSVIGRDIGATLRSMVQQNPTPLDVASDDNRCCGCVVRVEVATRRACGIEAVNIGCPE